ncbi:MAG: 50S ribosomal protein L24 [Candidatus Paceibacterota bacterium]|jgi:large subunit ribosomal protein L24
MKIRKNDTIKIIAGKDRGKNGKVLKVFPKKDTILVDGLNLFKKHVKPKKQGQKGEIILVPRPLDSSKVMIVCSSCQKATRVGYRIEDNQKVRICKKCQSKI